MKKFTKISIATFSFLTLLSPIICMLHYVTVTQLYITVVEIIAAISLILTIVSLMVNYTVKY